MSKNETNAYDIDVRIVEIYDQVETQTEDVKLIRRLIGGRERLRILEPFCGNGRILIPLAVGGHEMVGMDQSRAMLDSARTKIARLTPDAQKRITLIEADVTTSQWPGDFDLVVLGGNCFYELAAPEEQEGCIASAASALRPGGYVYVDNNHMEGDLDDKWRKPGVTKGFPTGTCADGAGVEGYGETIWWDAPRRLVRFRRGVKIIRPDGSTQSREWIQQKHPVSMGEVKTWLEAHGFAVEHLYGDRRAGPYTLSSPRAIFWARREGTEDIRPN
ncbi:MAG: methyltransferase domain-containing protein [Planctomycetota bacterium]